MLDRMTGSGGPDGPDRSSDERARMVERQLRQRGIADERVLAAIGMPGARQRTLHALCSRLAAGDLVLDARADPSDVREDLLAIPGIGPWTADYIALRALGDADAFPAGDLGLRRSARALGLPHDTAGLEARSQRWRPWRRYAAHYLWAAGA